MSSKLHGLVWEGCAFTGMILSRVAVMARLADYSNDEGLSWPAEDGEPVDIPAGRWVELRVEMPHNSPWNIKQLEAQETREKAERERQNNNQDAQQ